MAEHFYGRYRSVHTSNMGAEWLIGALSRIGRMHAVTEDECAVVAFLESRMSQSTGFKSFDLDPCPSALGTSCRLKVLGRFVAACARELAVCGHDSAARHLAEDPRVRLNFLACLVAIYQMIDEALSPDEHLPAFPALGLSDRETERLGVVLLQNQLAHAKRRGTPSDQAALLDEIAARIQGSDSREFNREELLTCHRQREAICQIIGDRIRQIAALRDVAALTSDREEQELVAEAICELLDEQPSLGD